MRYALVLSGIVALAAPATAVADTTVLKLGTLAPEGSKYMEDLDDLARDVERLSDGTLKIKWIPGGALGDDVEMAELLAHGKLDGGGFTDAGLKALVPQCVIWTMPGLFEDYGEVDHIEQRFKKRFEELFEERGFVLLMWADVGFLHVFSDEPVKSLDDLREQTLWMWTDDPSGIWAMKQIGADVTVSSLRGLADGLRDGSITTYQYPPLAAIAWGFHEHSKYISELRYRFMIGGWVLDKKVFDGLPADQQRLLRSVGRKWERRMIKSWRAESNKAIRVLEKHGLTSVGVEPADRETYYQATGAIQAEFAKRYDVEELFGEVAASLRRFRDTRRSR